MSVFNLDRMFRPASIAVIGASARPGSVGNVVMRNLVQGHFAGPVHAVNPSGGEIEGVRVCRSIAELPAVPELAVICTPPEAVAASVAELGLRGTRAAVVITAGARAADGSTPFAAQLLAAARPHGLRILGPNCIGLLLPPLGINASFAHLDSRPGKLAFISQSGALCTTVLDWARARNIGFSAFVSLGDGADVDLGDLLDYFGSHHETRGILVYAESITQARKFLSAGRAAARNKKVIVLKSGRHAGGARAAFSHTGAMAGRDDVVDAVIRRAGMLRVDSIEELFDAAETLAHARPVRGSRLAILTNGGGPGVLAADALAARGGQLAELSAAARAALDGVLPATWSRGNPVDIIGDAGADRYTAALDALTRDADFDAVLVLLVPTALVDGVEVAHAVAARAAQLSLPVLCCWLGDGTAEPARRVLAEAGVPGYPTPEAAVRAFMQMVEFDRNQRALMQVPPSIPEAFAPRRELARAVIEAALAAGRDALDAAGVSTVLEAYAIPVVESRQVESPDAAAVAAAELGFPLALKLRSPEISHKSEVGGVALALESAQAVRAAAAEMQARVRRLRPDARIEGFVLQRMVQRRAAVELIAGMSDDPVFGPVLLFGAGGTATELIADKAVSLPPLDLALAADLVARTRISRLLQGYRERPAADLAALHLTLVKLSHLVTDHAEIAELDINPLLLDASGVLALDARIRIVPARAGGAERLAIRPYPRELESTVELAGTELLLRPIRPEDAPAHAEFFRRVSGEDKYLRFFRAMHDIPPEQLARFTQLDYDREMALVALQRHGTAPETLGVVHVATDADNRRAEFAIIVRSDWHGRGLGKLLLGRIIDYCRGRGTGRLVGTTLLENAAMLGLARRLGFTLRPVLNDRLVEMELQLAPAG